MPSSKSGISKDIKAVRRNLNSNSLLFQSIQYGFLMFFVLNHQNSKRISYHFLKFQSKIIHMDLGSNSFLWSGRHPEKFGCFFTKNYQKRSYQKLIEESETRCNFLLSQRYCQKLIEETRLKFLQPTSVIKHIQVDTCPILSTKRYID